MLVSVYAPGFVPGLPQFGACALLADFAHASPFFEPRPAVRQSGINGHLTLYRINIYPADSNRARSLTGLQ